MSDDLDAGRKPTALDGVAAALVRLAAWAWTIAAGGGGLWLLATRGPMRLTNGWFALLSGVAACPLTAWLVKKYTGVAVPGWASFAAAVLLFAAGRIALAAGL